MCESGDSRAINAHAPYELEYELRRLTVYGRRRVVFTGQDEWKDGRSPAAVQSPGWRPLHNDAAGRAHGL